MRSTVWCVLVCVGVLAAAGALRPASASVSTVLVWPGSVITYRDLTKGPRFHRAVAAAVRGWNRLKLGVALQPVHGPADVRISLARGRCLRGRAGKAPLGFRALGSRVVLSRSCPVVVRPLLVAHELGRALGLPVDNSRCSLMNSKAASDGLTYVVPARCSRRHPPRWLRSLIDPATAASARVRYTPPLRPGAITLSVDAQGIPTVDWAQAADATAAATVVARTAATCPTDRDVAAGAVAAVFDGAAVAGSHSVVDSSIPRSGAECYRAFVLNRFGRASESPNAVSYAFGGPIAGFGVSGAVAGAQARFTDVSISPKGSIDHWHWDFGDPASGAANVVDTSNPSLGRAPSHVYAKAGTYDVTLTAADTTGLASTMVEGIVVGAAS